MIAIALISALVGLGGWYVFLRSKSGDLASDDTGRGLGDIVPSFTGNVGNTFQNVLSSIVGTNQGQGATGGAVSQLWHVSINPVAGAAFVKTREGERLLFVERATGNVFSADTKTGMIERLSNTLMPKIYQASFTSDGAIMQQGIDQNGRTSTFVGIMVPPTASEDAESDDTLELNTLEGSFLPPDIASISINPVKREYFYIGDAPGGGVVGIKSAWDGTGQKTIFRSDLHQWRSRWLSDGRIVVAQNPADNVLGYAYTIDAGGSVNPLMRAPGLTILPLSGATSLLYGTSEGGSLALHSRSAKGATEKLSIKTLADKCVWLPEESPRTPSKEGASVAEVALCAVPQKLGVGDFLNNWYAGRIHTNDNIWRIDVSDGGVQMIYPLESIDVIYPTANEGGTMIAFMDYRDLSLWLLQLPSKTPKEVSTSTPAYE